MIIAPSRNLIKVVAARNRRAGHQKKHLAQGEFYLRRFTRILYRPKMIEQKRKAILDEYLFHKRPVCCEPDTL